MSKSSKTLRIVNLLVKIFCWMLVSYWMKSIIGKSSCQILALVMLDFALVMLDHGQRSLVKLVSIEEDVLAQC